MLEERLPSPEEIRQKIDGMNTAKSNGKVYQNAFRYLYLTAGVVSEITGKNAPLGSHVISRKISEVDAVIFPVRTARKKGKVRPIALPMSPLFERWTAYLYDWFRVHEDAQPFSGLCMRSFQRKALEVFKGLAWPVEGYNKTIYVEPEKSSIKLERTRTDGIREYLVEYPNLERRWVENPKIQLKIETREKHWRSFSLQSLRHQRIRELQFHYGFTDEEIKIYTGLASMNRNKRYSSALDRYNWVNPSEDLQVEALVYASKGYFGKLLKYRDERREEK